MRRSARHAALSLLLIAFTLPLYLAGQRRNPPGFYLDESSIAYNALTIARSGVDEHGVSYPLYFRAFGEYKNPAYIYLLAGVFEITTPENLTARRLSAFLGYFAAVALGVLGFAMTGKFAPAVAAFLTALFTPNLFEISRLTFEVALYPLALALFLIAAHTAARREQWGPGIVAALVSTLTLLTFTYSIGRLQGPMLAVTLLLFWTRRRWKWLATMLVAYLLVAILPLILFNKRHDGALTARFQGLTYLTRSAKDMVPFTKHYVENLLPLDYALRGDPNGRHHVQGSGGSILLMTIILAVIGTAVGLFADLRDRWWLFLVAGTLLSVVPAALTIDENHSLRLVPFPIFLIALSIPCFALSGRLRLIVAAAILIGVVQASFFMIRFHAKGADRIHDFDGGFRRALADAVARPERPIWIDGAALYIHAYWYGALSGLPPSAFVRVVTGPPQPRLIISENTPGPTSTVLSRHGRFNVHIAK